MTFLVNQIQKLKKEKYAGEETANFFSDAERLRKGEPYEYVLGHTVFLGTQIDLSFCPMIPRPESAFWLERTINELKERQKMLNRPLRLADVFAGSGALGIALAKHFPDAEVDICELDSKLKEQIEINIIKNNLDSSRVHAITASSLEGLKGKYDGIVAVPPYIPYDALPELDREMIDFEPHLAFLAHNDGHEFHEILIRDTWNLLEEGGTLYMEADMGHEGWIQERVKGTKWSSLELWPDPYGATPNVVLRK